jgi:hypothetical protein
VQRVRIENRKGDLVTADKEHSAGSVSLQGGNDQRMVSSLPADRCIYPFVDYSEVVLGLLSTGKVDFNPLMRQPQIDWAKSVLRSDVWESPHRTVLACDVLIALSREAVEINSAERILTGAKLRMETFRTMHRDAMPFSKRKPKRKWGGMIGWLVFFIWILMVVSLSVILGNSL